MKRFIDLRGQIFADEDLPPDQQRPCFAFYCTVTDSFETFFTSQTWSSYEDFRDDYASDRGNLDAGFDRLFALMPTWARTLQAGMLANSAASLD